MHRRGTRLFTVLGGLAILYGIVVMGYVATSPDLRMRCLIVDQLDASNPAPGLKIEQTRGLKTLMPNPDQDPLQAGDRIQKIWDQEVHSFFDFTEVLRKTHFGPFPSDRMIKEGEKFTDLAYLPGLVEEYNTGTRWVRVEYHPAESEQLRTAWVQVQSIPLSDVALSFLWFLLQLGILAVGAIAYWYRPFDRSARLFFVMGLTTLCAYMGGFHWWVISAQTWLVLPFVVCATLVPVVTLHFFLVYPRPHQVFIRWPRATIVCLYAVPIFALIGFLGSSMVARWLYFAGEDEVSRRALLLSLRWLSWGVYTYLNFAGLYFLLSLIVLFTSYRKTTRNPVEHSQVRWIFSAGLVASIPISYSLYLALVGDRSRFALGAASLPMFLASLSFMLAYAVSMIRHRLMWLDQIVGKGVLYYTVNTGLLVAFASCIALGSLTSHSLNVRQTPIHLLAWSCVLILAVMLILWLRDRIQLFVDRRFFREKYQLDKALQRMNQAVGEVVNPSAISELLLSSCREVIRVEQTALYLRVDPDGPFQLMAAEWSTSIPMQLPFEESWGSVLLEKGSLLKVVTASRQDLSPAQSLLREFSAELIHPLESDGKLAGLVLLGEKKNGSPFTAEDLTFLNAMGQITNIALHSAKMHQDLSQLNEELQLKSQRINEQKRQIALLQTELNSFQAPRPLEIRHDDDDEVEFRREAIIGNSPVIETVFSTVRKVAQSESTVLIRGESGTGKELLAHVIHQNSSRRDGPMISVHCASLSPSLLESELFGHVQGAFTGAHQDKIGRFQAADGGTLFLDEIGDISPATQIKLLRVLQERSFEPVGGTQTIHVDVHLITATHQNLEELIEKNKFRQDLFYRLNVISITMPPLRDRQQDLLELAIYFKNQAAQRIGKNITHLDEAALTALERYHWPGNVRELQNAIERAVVLAEQDHLTMQDLPQEVQAAFASPAVTSRPRVSVSAPSTEGQPESEPEPATVPAGTATTDERSLLEETLALCGGNKAEAARMLGMPRSTFYSKLKKHKIV